MPARSRQQSFSVERISRSLSFRPATPPTPLCSLGPIADFSRSSQGTKSAISQLNDFIRRSGWTRQRYFGNTRPTAKRWQRYLKTATRKLYGNGWRRDGSSAPSWLRIRTRTGLVSLRRTAQSHIETRTLGRAWPGKLKFRPPAPTRRTPRRIAKRWIKRRLRGNSRGGLSDIATTKEASNLPEASKVRERSIH